MRGPARNPSQRKPTFPYPPPVFLPRRAWCKAPFTLYGFASFIEVNRYLSQYLHQSLFCQVPFLAFGILLSPHPSIRRSSLTSSFYSAVFSCLILLFGGLFFTSCCYSVALFTSSYYSAVFSCLILLFGALLFTSSYYSALFSSPHVTIQLLHFIIRPRQAVYYSSGKHSQSCRETKTIALCVTKCML